MLVEGQGRGRGAAVFTKKTARAPFSPLKKKRPIIAGTQHTALPPHHSKHTHTHRHTGARACVGDFFCGCLRSSWCWRVRARRTRRRSERARTGREGERGKKSKKLFLSLVTHLGPSSAHRPPHHLSLLSGPAAHASHTQRAHTLTIRSLDGDLALHARALVGLAVEGVLTRGRQLDGV